jgi:HrpA-like RNA helicase
MNNVNPAAGGRKIGGMKSLRSDAGVLPTVPELPVAAILSDVVTAARGGAVVVTAPPGSGKTTLVPAAVLDDLPSPGKG